MADPARERYAYVDLPDYAFFPLARDPAPPASALAAYLDGDRAGAWLCPDAASTSRSPHVSLRVGGLHYTRVPAEPKHYALNEAVLGFESDPATVPVRGRGLLSRVRSASRTLLVSDAGRHPSARQLHAWHVPPDATTPTTLADAVAAVEAAGLTPLEPGRHRGRAVVGHADGHAAVAGDPDEVLLWPGR